MVGHVLFGGTDKASAPPWIREGLATVAQHGVPVAFPEGHAAYYSRVAVNPAPSSASGGRVIRSPRR